MPSTPSPVATPPAVAVPEAELPDPTRAPIPVSLSDDSLTRGFQPPTVVGVYTRSTEGIRLSRFVGRAMKPVSIRQSAFGDATVCRRRYAFRHRFGLRSKGYSSAREKGSLTHLLLKHLYLGKTLEQAVAEGRIFIEKYMDDLLEHECLLEQSVESIRAGLTMDFTKAIAITTIFWENLALDPDRFKAIAVELPLKVSVPGLKAPLEMTIDLSMLDQDKDEIWLFDHKTTSYDPRLYQWTAPFDPQTRIYRVGMTAWVQSGQATLLDGTPIPPTTPVVGVQYNPIKVPSIRQKRKQTWDDYLEEVREWYRGEGRHENTSTGGKNALVDPYPHRFAENLFDPEFEVHLKEMDWLATTDPWFARFPRTPHTALCRNYFGKPCAFLEICHSDPRIWRTAIERQFTSDHPLVVTPVEKETPPNDNN